MWSGAARSTPINDKTDRKKPSAWRKGTRKTRRSVNAVSVAQSENVFGAPGRPDGDGRHASVASAESHSVTSPRWTKACSYADQFPTRYFALYFGWTFDLMSRSCTRSGHRGQRAYSCLVAAEGLCTNARVTADAAYETIGFYEAAGARGATVVVPPTRTGVVARIVTGPHDAHRQDPHLPIRYDTGRPSSVIRLRISQPRTTSLPWPVGLRARRPSPMMDLYRKNVFSTRL